MIRFLDVDGTITEEGSDEVLPGVVKTIQKWKAAGDMIVFFTCRPPQTGWIPRLAEQGIEADGYLHKPLGDAYAVYDNKLAESGTEIPHG